MRTGFFPGIVAFLIAQVIPAQSGLQDRMSILPRTEFEVVGRYPHDSNAYTQGLVWHKGGFYESTGLYGQSTLRRVDLETGTILQLTALQDEYFGEGITIINSTIVQLTWETHKGFVYDKESFNLLQQFSYPTEGWGITFDGSRLIF